MNLLHRIPLLVPAIAFAMGILLKSWTTLSDSIVLAFASVLLMAWWLRLMRTRGVFRGFLFPWSLLTVGMFLLGCLWFRPAELTQKHRPSWSEKQYTEVAGILEKPLNLSAKGRTGQIITYARRKEGDAWRGVVERMKFFTRDTVLSLEVGDTVFVKAKPKLLETESTSYQAYLDKQGLRYILFSKTIKQGGIGTSWRIRLGRMQKRLSKHWDNYCEKEEIAGLAKAMFLGNKTGLNRETKDRFAIAGFSHLLAISGLHVGILFVLLSSLTKPMQGWQWGRWLGTILLLGALVSFSLLTGASPSVVRASNMLGVYLLVRLVHQRIHPMNVLAFCGLLQLIWAPEDLLTVGFQLSYLAVGVLLWLLPKYAAWVKTPFPLLNRLFDLIGVNLLATAATAPLVWYYFGTFPTYFLPANLVVAPVIFVLVFSGFLSVILSLVSPVLAGYTAWICEKGLMALDFVARETVQWPFSRLDGWAGQEIGWGILALELGTALLLILTPKIFMVLRTHYSKNGIKKRSLMSK
ncbi:MAG: ComEC/Rec2 family competence protein [Bacteroidia bacterium]